MSLFASFICLAAALQFLARAIVDELLPPSFLLDRHVAALGGKVVDKAKVSRSSLLSLSLSLSLSLAVFILNQSICLHHVLYSAPS